MRAQLGHPESFTAYLARVARALGVTRFCWATERRAWSYHDTEHRFADEMTYQVNRICRDFAKEHMDAGETGGQGAASDEVPNPEPGARPA